MYKFNIQKSKEKSKPNQYKRKRQHTYMMLNKQAFYRNAKATQKSISQNC